MDEFEKKLEEEARRQGYRESYLSAMKQRLNLQVLGCYIRDGCSKEAICYNSFHEREDSAFSKLKKRINEQCGEKESEEIITQVIDYADVVQEIYFNLGMKAGVTLHSKLTDNFETDI